MLNQWLSRIAWLLLLGAFLLMMGAGGIWFHWFNEADSEFLRPKGMFLPKNTFECSKEAYEAINGSLLALQEAPPTIQLPDLRQQIIFCGKNGRPDADPKRPSYHFIISGSGGSVGGKGISSFKTGEKAYMISERRGGGAYYAFSPGNQPTSLWFEPHFLTDTEVEVHLFMKSGKEELIQLPEAHAKFQLSEKDMSKLQQVPAGQTQHGNWDQTAFRLDASLLARQRARWMGPDRFLELHGGDEFQSTIGKQRIDLGEGENIYSVFIGSDSGLIWDGSRWKESSIGEASLAYPLLVVKKIEERLMSLELWDIDGRSKSNLNLLKTADPSCMQQAHNLQHLFKFLGAKTRTQFVFEVNHERMMLAPSDWLLMTPKGWKKLATLEEIDDFVNRKTVGNLFVFEGIKRKDGHQYITGTFFSTGRNEYHSIEWLLQQGNTKAVQKDVQEVVNEAEKQKRQEASHLAQPNIPVGSS